MDKINACFKDGEKCINCASHFSSLKPDIKEIIISKHFKKDFPDYENMVQNIIDCSHDCFFELHKYEEHINGSIIFRAKKDSIHFVYAIDSKKRLLFLRALKNFKEYSRFLSDKHKINAMINEL